MLLDVTPRFQSGPELQREKAEGDRMWRRQEELYAQDRESMKGKAYLELGECFSVHDIAITQAQGVVHQQANEHLSSSDIAIVRARRMLDEAVDELISVMDSIQAAIEA